MIKKEIEEALRSIIDLHKKACINSYKDGVNIKVNNFFKLVHLLQEALNNDSK